MDAEVYPNEKVANFITQNFVPVKIHVKEQPSVFERFGTQWTPTLLLVDADGTKRHRFEGYLPVDDFLAQLHLGLARAAFARKRWAEAEQRYRDVVERFPRADAAPEALYWAAVAKYKATNDPAALREAAQQFRLKYPESVWAKKASVWAPEQAATA